MSVIAYGEVVLLRRRFGVPGSQRPQFMGITELSSKVRAFFDHPTPYSWPMLYIATGTPLLLLLWMLRSQVSRPESRLLVAACVMLAISLVFGEVTEPRVFLPIFAIPIYVITVAGSRIGLAGTSFRDVDGIRGIDRAVEIP